MSEENIGSYKTLSTIDAIRLRSEMYIGSKETPSHLLTEVLDNILDEITSDYANWGGFQHNEEDGSYWVYDNGRGIEIYDMKLHDGTIQDSLITLVTTIHSGSKFDNNDYDQGTVGMNGVGLVAVNALSEWLIVKTRDRKNKNVVYEYYFEDSNFKYRNIDNNNTESFSTIVAFKPNGLYFNSLEFDLRSFKERLLLCQSKLPNKQFFVNSKNIPKIDFDTFVRAKLNIKDKEYPIYKLEYKFGKNNIDLFITYDINEETINIGDVNLRQCDGTYISNIQNMIKNALIEKLDNKKYPVETIQKIFTNGLKFYASVQLENPRFDSQSKTRMVTSIAKELLVPLKSNFSWLVSQKDILNIIYQIFDNKLKKGFIKNTSSTKYVSAANKLKDCLNHPGEILYITEGDSASGTLKQCRNIKNEAIFPLKGKVLNVEKASLNSLQKNEEIKWLLEAVGDNRFKYIKALADADADGDHINTLITILMYNLLPDYIKEGRFKIILPPLYGAKKNNKTELIYNKEDLIKYQTGYQITRFKGLGEMNPDQLKTVIRSGKEYTVKFPDNDKAIMDYIYNSDLKRQLLNDLRFNKQNIFNAAETISS